MKKIIPSTNELSKEDQVIVELFGDVFLRDYRNREKSVIREEKT